ncbi:glycosyltransferase family 39 protein [Thermopirellula anaerolimosa]
MHQGKQQWRVYLLLGIIIAGGLALRLYRLCDRSIWFDEAFSWRLAQYPPGEMLRRVTLDNNLPLYFGLLKGWVGCFGDSLFAMRLLSVLLGTAAIAAMFLFVREARRWCCNEARQNNSPRQQTETALVASLFLAVSVFQIRWSWDIRAYALGTLLALLTSWTLLTALRSTKHAFRWWLSYAVLALLFAYTHYFALFTLAIQGVFALYLLWDLAGNNLRDLFRSRKGRYAVASFVLVAAGWAVWMPFFYRQFHQVQESFWIASLQRWEIAHTVYRMFMEPEEATLSLTASLWALDLCVLGWVVFLWRPDRVRIYVAASALVPIASAVLLDRLGVHLFFLRYFLFAHMFFLAALAMLVGRIPLVPERHVVIGGLAVSGLLLVWQFHAKINLPQRPGTEAAARWILEHAEPDDPVVVNSAFCYLPVLYYLRDRGGCYLYRANNDGRVPHYLGAAVIEPEEMVTQEQLASFAGNRIWFVESTNRVGAADSFPPADPRRIIRQMNFPDVFGLGTIRVHEYVPWKQQTPIPKRQWTTSQAGWQQ